MDYGHHFSVNSRTSLYGLLGNPVGHSLSPLIQNRAFFEIKQNSIYLTFLVDEEDLSSALRGVRSLRIKGLNVTIPFKEKVIPFLDQISEDALEIGAVNTIVNQNGYLRGYNTDGEGFARSLKKERSYSFRDKDVVILGAGGAARGVALQLLKERIRSLTILNRTKERLDEVVLLLQKKGSSIPIKGYLFNQVSFKDLLAKTQLLIHSTPVGMSPWEKEEPLVPLESLHQDLLVVDLVYNPLETTLLRRAKEVGAKTFGGWGMLLYQGALSFELWTGKKAPVEVMKEVLLSQLHG